MLGRVKHTFSPAWFVAVLLLVLPWLNPVTYGPTHAVVQFLTVWLGAVLCWMVCSQARMDGSQGARLVAIAWLLAATASACIGLLQYLGAAGPLSPWVNYVGAGESYGNLRQRNQQATLLAIGFCALLWWQARQVNATQATALALLWRWILGVALLLLASADAATGSRTGMLQLVVLLALGLVWRRGRLMLFLSLLAYAVAAVALPHLADLDPMHSGILGRVGEASSPCSSRLVLWSNVLHLIAQKPWLGWGWGELSYAHFMTLYPGDRFCEILGNAHNLPLHLAVELGIPVAVLVCAALLGLVWRGKPWREQDPTRQMAWSVLAVIGVHSLLEYPLWYAPFQLAVVLAVWLLWHKRTAAQTTDTTVPSHFVTRRGPGALAAFMLLACSYTAWDYWRISQIYMPESARALAYRDNTLEKIRSSWLFSDQVAFAVLGVTPLTAENAFYIHAVSLDMLHLSPETSVVTKLIESAQLLGLSDEVQTYKTRFQAAYPQDYARWQAAQKASSPGDKAP